MAISADKREKTPKYVQLADLIRDQILSGEIPPHNPLLSFSEMKEQFNAAQRTVEKAHSILEDDGLIRREPRRGLFVNDPSTRVKTDFIAFANDKHARDLAYHREIERGMRIQAEAFGKSITLVDNPDTFKHWKSMDGIIVDILGPFQTGKFDHPCPKNIPIVRLHNNEAGASSVMADDATGVRLGVEHLCELGHKRIGFLLRGLKKGETPPGLSTIKIRHEAYCQTMKARNLVSESEWSNFYDCKYTDFRDAGYDVMRNWLQAGWCDLKLTAMLAQNDHLAFGMIRALQEEGIRVPEDVSIVGYDGCDTSEYSPISLTTVVVPLREIGATVMRVLTQHIHQPYRPCENIMLPVTLRAGGSTAPPANR